MPEKDLASELFAEYNEQREILLRKLQDLNAWYDE